MAPYQFRKVFILPFVLGTAVWSFTMCYGWWLADSIQFLLLGINFLLFILSAYLLRKPRVHHDAAHSFTLFVHQCMALGLLFAHRWRAIGFGDLFPRFETKIPPLSAREQVLGDYALLLRIMVLFWSTAITFLSGVVLFDWTDFLTEGEINRTYNNLTPFMRVTGFFRFVRMVMPIPSPAPITLNSWSIDDLFSRNGERADEELP
ncbi:hypothetical protein C8J57DRAFT_1714844 [Mycena rebaudengoi]|nr:hypothetical protein C8J57DRAFT_1714844 [Mycena rebaudengoi]